MVILAFEIIYEYTTENGIMKATGIAGLSNLTQLHYILRLRR